METFQPKLRFPEFKGNWDKKKLVEITSLITKGTTPKKFVEKGIYYIKTDCFIDNEIDIKRCSFIEETTHNTELKRSIIKENDLLFTITGATIGKCVVVNKVVLPANTNQNLAIIRLNKDENKDYIFQILTSEKMNKYILDNSTIGAQPSLNLEQIGSFSFPYPKIEEQKKIANFLSSVDKKLNFLKEKKTFLENYKKGLTQKIFNQEIRFKDDNGNDFEDWEEKSIGNILSIGSGRDYKHLNLGNVPVYGTGGLMTYVDSFLHQGETVCIGRKGTIDKPMYFNGDIWTVDTLFYTHTFVDSIPKYVFYVFQSINWKQHNEASGVPSLSKSTIEQISINVPSVPEQTKIANFLSAIDEKIELVSTQIEETQEYKKGLLQQMFV